MKHLSVGVIIENTVIPREVATALIDLFKDVGKDDRHTELMTELNGLPDDSQEISDFCDEIEGELFDYAPPFTYFGTAEGDGACYGLWADIESVEEAVRDDEIRVLDGISDDYEGIVVDVNDHGNVSLINHKKGGELESLWAVV